MSIFSAISNFFKGLFDKVKKLWGVVKPFLQEIFNQSTQAVLASLQTLAIEAVQYVAAQGLPNDQAKQEAFKAYMLDKAKEQVNLLKDWQLNLLREIAVAIWKKAQE